MAVCLSLDLMLFLFLHTCFDNVASSSLDTQGYKYSTRMQQ